jgi:hypothetical protein
MPDAKLQVSIPDFAVKDMFEGKFKAAAIEAMGKAATAAVKGKFEIGTDKKAKGWCLNGSLVSMKEDKGAMKAEVSVAIGAMPGNSIKSIAKGSAAFPDTKASDMKAKDVGELAAAAVEQAMKSGLKYMLSNKPE